MKKGIGAVLIGLGLLSIIFASSNARNAPDLSFLIGTFLPGLFFLIIGLVLRREKTPPAVESSPGEDQQPSVKGMAARSKQFQTRANLGILGGIVLMFVGSGLAQQGPDLWFLGITVLLGGWALLIWGCANYMRYKGYSGWFGLFGYLLLPGLLILVCFPNRRNRLSQDQESEPNPAREALAAEDQSPGYRYALALLPLGLLFVSFAGFQFVLFSDIDAAEWQEVAPEGLGFRALMP